MFWTKFIKVIGWVLAALGVIASIILGVAFGSLLEDEFYLTEMEGFGTFCGFVIFIVGVIVTVISVARIMVLCEISSNVDKIRQNSEKQTGSQA